MSDTDEAPTAEELRVMKLANSIAIPAGSGLKIIKAALGQLGVALDESTKLAAKVQQLLKHREKLMHDDLDDDICFAESDADREAAELKRVEEAYDRELAAMTENL